MKKLLLCTVVLFVSLCASAQYRVTAVSHTSETATMRCVGFGKKARVAANDAELSAIKTILFNGLPNSRFSLPLIPESQATAEKEHKKQLEALYDADYKTFIETSTIVVPFGKNSLKQKCITLDVCVKVVQLRKYLEDNGVIRKFGL